MFFHKDGYYKANQRFEKIKPPFATTSITGHGGIKGGIAVLFLYNTHPPNILRSKKAYTHRRGITVMSMNTQII